VKPTYLAQHGHQVINPKLPDEDFEEAVRVAQADFDKHRPQAVVGSSRRGAVAMTINGGNARRVLLCPAWKKHGTVKTVKPGTVILHARADEVVPFADSEELVRNSGLAASALIEGRRRSPAGRPGATAEDTGVRGGHRRPHPMTDRIIAIGDVHGCAKALATLLNAVQPTQQDTLVFLGDYNDCGPDSRGVVEQVIALGKRCTVVPLLGNHEEMVLAALEGRSELDFWMKFGGREALASYGYRGGRGIRPGALRGILPAEHLAFFKGCRDYFETVRHIFVHAYYDPHLPLPACPAPSGSTASEGGALSGTASAYLVVSIPQAQRPVGEGQSQRHQGQPHAQQVHPCGPYQPCLS
jgi:hypothetical protein